MRGFTQDEPGNEPKDERLNWRSLASWLPAVILPSATATQLFEILRSGSGENVSPMTWFLFFLANIGALFLGKPENGLARIQMGLAFALTALLDLAIIGAILRF